MKALCAEASMTSGLKPGIGEQSRCAKFFSDFLSLHSSSNKESEILRADLT